MATTKTTKSASKRSSKPAASKSVSSKSTSKSMTLADVPKLFSDKKNKKTMLIIGGVIVIAALLYLGRGLLFVALVNGEPVSRIAVIQELEAQGGKQTLDKMVSQKLILQEASKKKITVSQKEVDTEFKKIEKQYADQGQKLEELLSAEGISKAKFEEEVRIQLFIEKLLGKDTAVSDKEFEDFLAKNEDLLANETDKEAAKAKLREQLQHQKLADKYKIWMEDLRKKAKIQYFVNY